MIKNRLILGIGMLLNIIPTFSVITEIPSMAVDKKWDDVNNMYIVGVSPYVREFVDYSALKLANKNIFRENTIKTRVQFLYQLYGLGDQYITGQKSLVVNGKNKRWEAAYSYLKTTITYLQILFADTSCPEEFNYLLSNAYYNIGLIEYSSELYKLAGLHFLKAFKLGSKEAEEKLNEMKHKRLY